MCGCLVVCVLFAHHSQPSQHDRNRCDVMMYPCYANVNPAAVYLPGIQLSFIVSALVSASKENQIFEYKSILSLILCFDDPFDDFGTIKVVQN